MKRLYGLSPLQRVHAHLTARPNGCLEWEGCCSAWGIWASQHQRQDCLRSQVAMGTGTRTGLCRLAGRPPWQVDHLCRNPKCGNLAHLEAVTKRLNGLRGTSPAALHAKKLTCPRGHLYDRLVIRPNGSRQRRCSRCISDQHKLAYRQRKGLPCDLSVSLRARNPNRRYRASDHGEMSR